MAPFDPSSAVPAEPSFDPGSATEYAPAVGPPMAQFSGVRAGTATSAPPAPYGDGFSDAAPTDFWASAGSALARTGADVARTGAMATAGAVDAGALDGFIAKENQPAFQDAAFKAAQTVKAWEQGIPVGDSLLGSTAGSLAGGVASLGIGQIAQGQDTIDQGGTAEQAQAATALGAGSAIAGLGTGMLGKAASTPVRMLMQGAAAGLTGEATREVGNEVLPDSMHRDFSLPELALNVGAGLGGAIGGHAEEIAGVHGPEAQGTATADTILGAADHATALTEPLKNPIPDGSGEAPHSQSTPEATREANPVAPLDTTAGAENIPALPAEPAPVQQARAFDLSPGQEKNVQIGDSRVRYTADEDGAHIIMVQTPPEARGNGSARTAMETLTADADAQGKPLTLDVAPTDSRVDEGRLQGFYESLGFKQAGTTKNGDVRMERLPVAKDDPVQTNDVVDSQRETTSAQAESTPPAGDEVPTRPAEEPAAPEGRPAGDNAAIEGRPATEAESQPSGVGVSRARIDQQRSERGLEAMPKAERETMDESLAKGAEKLAENPAHGEQLAESLIKRPRALNAEEVGVLAAHHRQLQNDYAKAAQAAADLPENASPYERIDAKEAMERVESKLETSDQALQNARKHGGQGLNMYKTVLAEDFSRIHILNVAKAKKGGKLSADEQAKFDALTKDVAEKQAIIDAHEKVNADLQNQLDSRVRKVDPAQKKSSAKDFQSLAERLRKIAHKDQLVDPNCVV